MRVASLSTLVATLAACGSEAPSIDYDPVAAIVGATIATTDGGGTVGAIQDSVVLAFGHMPMGFADEDGMMSGEHGLVHHEYKMIECRDREHRLLERCDITTDTATLISKWSGAVRQPDFDFVSRRQGMWTLSGLQHVMMDSWTPSVDGSAQIEGDAMFADAHYVVFAYETETMAAAGPVMGGTMRLGLDVTRGDAALHVDAVATFDSAEVATLVLDDMVTYRVDLHSGRVEQVVR